MTKLKFLRSCTRRHKRLGRNLKKNQKWRRARGRHNKIREKRKGCMAWVEVGHKKEKKERFKINGKLPLLVRNLKDVSKIGKDHVVIIGKIGKKKRLEILVKLKEKNIKVLNKWRENESKG